MKTKLLTAICALLTFMHIGVYPSRSDLLVGQEYTITGYAFDAEQYTARLDVPQGIELLSTPVITATQVITAGVTFNWRIRVLPTAQRNSLLIFTMTVNDQQTTTHVIIEPDPPTQFNRVYLPIAMSN